MSTITVEQALKKIPDELIITQSIENGAAKDLFFMPHKPKEYRVRWLDDKGNKQESFHEHLNDAVEYYNEHG